MKQKRLREVREPGSRWERRQGKRAGGLWDGLWGSLWSSSQSLENLDVELCAPHKDAAGPWGDWEGSTTEGTGPSRDPGCGDRASGGCGHETDRSG